MNWKTMVLIVVMASSTIALQAQRVAIGGKVGFTASSFRSDDVVNIELRKGAVGGVFLNAYFLKVLAIQPEVIFKQSGGKYKFKEGSIEYDIHVNYIQVPILFKLQIPIAHTVYPNIFIGPQYSYAVKTSHSSNGGIWQDIDVNRNDFGGVFGAGVDVRAKRFFWTIDFRYGMSALKIAEDNRNLIEFDMKNQDFTISTGIGVLLGKVK